MRDSKFLLSLILFLSKPCRAIRCSWRFNFHSSCNIEAEIISIWHDVILLVTITSSWPITRDTQGMQCAQYVILSGRPRSRQFRFSRFSGSAQITSACAPPTSHGARIYFLSISLSQQPAVVLMRLNIYKKMRVRQK